MLNLSWGDFWLKLMLRLLHVVDIDYAGLVKPQQSFANKVAARHRPFL